jgi:WD40 repeat protein
MSKKITILNLMALLIGVAVSWLLIMQPSLAYLLPLTPPEVEEVQARDYDYYSAAAVNSVAFSPDGKTALSGSDDKTIKWWDLSTGRVIKTLEAHSSVHSVAFSPDGKTALSGSGSWDNKDNTVKWWDLSTGRVIKILKGHHSTVSSVAFSPDSKTALSGDSQCTRLWNLETGEEIIQMYGFSHGEVTIMPKQGYYVASPNGEQYVKVRIGDTYYDIDKYKTFYYRPDIIKLALQFSETERAITLANQQKTQRAIQTALKTPPQKRHGSKMTRKG